MFSMQHTPLTACYANMSRVCVFVDMCVVSVTLSLLVPPPPFSSRLACYPLAWGRVWQRDNPCRYVSLTPRCSCLLRILGELGRLPLSLSPALFFFCYKYSSGHMLPQFTAELMVFVRPTHPGSGCVKVIWSSALEASLPGSQSDSGAARCDAGSPAGVWRSGASLTPGLTDFIWYKQELLPSWEMCIHATNLKTNKDNYFSPTVFVFLY